MSNYEHRQVPSTPKRYLVLVAGQAYLAQILGDSVFTLMQ
jgi:hypothetical protein